MAGLERHEFDQALSLIRDGIKRYAESRGASNLYHETLTVFWLRIVHHAVQAYPDIAEFEAFLDRFPLLQDKGLPLRHWRPETLWSQTARISWAEPDIIRLR